MTKKKKECEAEKQTKYDQYTRKKQYTNCESDKISELRELGVAIIDMLK